MSLYEALVDDFARYRSSWLVWYAGFHVVLLRACSLFSIQIGGAGERGRDEGDGESRKRRQWIYGKLEEQEREGEGKLRENELREKSAW